MKNIISLLCLSFISHLAIGQLQEIQNVSNDLFFLTDKYITPAAEASVFQASGGWYTSAKPKNKFDVEVSLQYNQLFIPKSRKTFLINESDLLNMSIQGLASSAQVPTALGNNDVVVLEGTINGNVFEFDSPEGINSNIIKHGQVQASIGLWKKTNFIVRYAPNVKINNTDYISYGFGLLHNINQWIPFLKDSDYHIAFLGTYSNFGVDDTFNAANLTIGFVDSISVQGQSYGFNLVTSKSVNKFDVSLGLGFASSNYKYEIGGQGDLLLTILNSQLTTINNTNTLFNTDLSINYNWNNFSLNSMLTLGRYNNLVLGANYSFI